MERKVLLKKSSVVSKIPLNTDLDFGELALNYTDGKLYYKKSDGITIDSFSSGLITSISTTSPLTTSGGSTPQISIPAATASISGYLTNTDWVTFNSKAPIVSPIFTTGIAITNNATQYQLAADLAGTYILKNIGSGGYNSQSIAGDTFIRNPINIPLIIGIHDGASMRISNTGFVFNNNILASNFSGSASGVNTGDQINISGTAGSETLSTVTSRNATTSKAIHINNQLFVGQNTDGTALIDAYGGYAYYGADSNSTGIRVNSVGDVNTTGLLTQAGNQVLHAANYNSYSPTLTGVSATGTWGINITGNATTVSNITANTGLLINSLKAPAFIDALTTSNFRATVFNTTSYGYAISTSRWNNIPAPLTGLGMYGTAISWSGDDTHGFLALNFNSPGAIIGGGNAQAINWTATLLHTANYNSYSPTLTGGSATGTWGINVTGSSTSTTYISSPDGDRTSSTKLPTTSPRQVRYDFITAAQSNGTGGYAGLMTYAPWDGTLASTGDSSYQLAFVNYSGVNASGLPGLSLRNGIGSTWNAWYSLLHSGNYSSYSPTLTGTGAIGTWGINITGSAASATGAAGSVNGLTITNSSNGINPNNVTQNQIGYNTNISLFGQTDGGLYSSAYSSSWIHQIYGDFRTGQIAIRGKLEGAWQVWRSVLDSGNYTSYSPTLTGGSATGTWNISITGSANTANTATTATSTPSISVDNSIAYGRAGLQFIQLSGASGDAASTTNTPDDNWWHIIRSNHANNAGYYTDLALPMTSASNIRYRRISNGASSGWITVLDSTNYNSYSPTLTGGSATGTWGINITGYAANTAMSANRTDSTPYPVLWGTSGSVSQLFSCAAVTIQSSTGTLSATTVTSTSDIRVKSNICKIDNALTKVMQLNGYTFDRIDINIPRQTGVIAQEVLEVLPEAVTGSEETYYAVAYGNMVGLLIEAIKEQQATINDQEVRINKLETLILKLTEGK